jgi:hypothetical protein
VVGRDGRCQDGAVLQNHVSFDALVTTANDNRQDGPFYPLDACGGSATSQFSAHHQCPPFENIRLSGLASGRVEERARGTNPSCIIIALHCGSCAPEKLRLQTRGSPSSCSGDDDVACNQPNHQAELITAVGRSSSATTMLYPAHPRRHGRSLVKSSDHRRPTAHCLPLSTSSSVVGPLHAGRHDSRGAKH